VVLLDPYKKQQLTDFAPHADNAIPIQGWISDPTDGDLMYLVPFLEGLQYVSDVRALLALRGGEDGQHMA
jgi:CTD nuclear envelope phosphatase 1